MSQAIRNDIIVIGGSGKLGRGVQSKIDHFLVDSDVGLELSPWRHKAHPFEPTGVIAKYSSVDWLFGFWYPCAILWAVIAVRIGSLNAEARRILRKSPIIKTLERIEPLIAKPDSFRPPVFKVLMVWISTAAYHVAVSPVEWVAISLACIPIAWIELNLIECLHTASNVSVHTSMQYELLPIGRSPL